MVTNEELQERLHKVVETAVYAPLGLLYEYDEVVPKLVRRGRSQVQLARMLGKAATDPRVVERGVNDAMERVGDHVAEGLIHFGKVLGITPETADNRPDERASGPTATSSAVVKVDGSTQENPAVELAFPIARYDELTAKEIVSLVGELSDEQRAVVRQYEHNNRARKTVLAKLDRLSA